MKMAISYGLRIPQIRVNVLSVMIYICVFVFLIFSAINVKFQCIRAGYDIDTLAKKNQQLTIKLQGLQIEKSKYVNKSKLYMEGKKQGLVLPAADNVYHVE